MTATDNQTTNGTNTNGNGASKQRATMTPVDAISKISKILDQLSPNDQKRVLAFVSESGQTHE